MNFKLKFEIGVYRILWIMEPFVVLVLVGSLVLVKISQVICDTLEAGGS